MADFTTLDKAGLLENQEELRSRYEAFKARGLSLDMTRGKPCPEQLDLALGLLDCLDADDFTSAGGTDCRNYGGVDGLPEGKELFADYLGVKPSEVIVGGNSSLQMMYDAIARAWTHGVLGGDGPWGRLPVVKFLCPSPGYDRHFAICRHFGMDMIPIDMTDDGPDMDAIETAVSDDSVKGIWCVPKYSNPTGVTYSDAVVDRFAAMRTGAPDFRIFWDNAYTVHHLGDEADEVKDILGACRDAGNEDRVYLFGSTSKVSFAGAALAVMAASEANIELAVKHLSIQTIGPDKLNQLRHVRFFKDLAGIEAHMKKHAAILRPKFETVLEILASELGGKNIAEWSRPRGGYFVSLDTMDGCARAVVEMSAEAGVKLTPAGATFPYGDDPRDRNIRIAPTLPSLDEIQPAIELVTIAIQLLSIEKLLERK